MEIVRVFPHFPRNYCNGYVVLASQELKVLKRYIDHRKFDNSARIFLIMNRNHVIIRHEARRSVFSEVHMRNSKSYYFLGIMLAFHISVFWNVTKGDLENITARDILQKHLENIANRPPMMADGEVVDKADRTVGRIETKYISRIYLDNKRHDITRNKWKLEDYKWVNTEEIRGIWDGSRYTGRVLTMEHTDVFGVRRPDYLHVTYSDWAEKYTVEWGTWAFGLGLSAGDKHFAKPLLESKTLRLRPEMEQTDGFECYVLEGDTRDYHYTVWIDPNNGYLHRKVIGKGYKTEELVKRLLEIKGVKIESFDGIPMVTEATRHIFSEYIDGNTIDLTAREKISNIVWNPDFKKEGAFKLDNIPNGTPVSYFADNMNETGIKFHWQDGKPVPNEDAAEPPSLIGKPLPGFENMTIDFNPGQVEANMLLVCFFDMNQRPSRNCLMQLSKKAKELKAKDVAVIVIQASKVDDNVLKEWVEKNKIPFPVGMAQADEEKIRFTWGVRSLPWLILTDKKHTVITEGFAINELDEKIKNIDEK
jgi:hypothetical protein